MREGRRGLGADADRGCFQNRGGALGAYPMLQRSACDSRPDPRATGATSRTTLRSPPGCCRRAGRSSNPTENSGMCASQSAARARASADCFHARRCRDVGARERSARCDNLGGRQTDRPGGPRSGGPRGASRGRENKPLSRAAPAPSSRAREPSRASVLARSRSARAMSESPRRW